jgi:hypothetical protein
MQNAQSVSDNSKQFIINDDLNVKCNIENDKLCKEIKTELENIAEIRSDALNQYQIFSDKYDKCTTLRTNCDNNAIDRKITQSELNYLTQEKQKLESVIQTCDNLKVEIVNLQNPINALQSEMNQLNTQIESINIDGIKCSDNRMKDIMNQKRSSLQDSINGFNGAKASWARRQWSLPRIRNYYKARTVNEARQADFNRYVGCSNVSERLQAIKPQLADMRNRLDPLVRRQTSQCDSSRYSKYSTVNMNYNGTQAKLNNLRKFDRINCRVLQNCETTFKPVIEAKYAEFNTLNQQHSLKQTDYDTCIDPTKNQCKTFYKNINEYEKDLAENVNMVRAGISSSEGFCEDIDSCTEDVKLDYEKLEESRSRMKSSLMGINNTSARTTTKPAVDDIHSIYASTVYTNIILTTASITIVYYLFSRIK